MFLAWQDPERIRAAMEASVARQSAAAGQDSAREKQRSAVSRQAAAVHPDIKQAGDGGFFAIPWPLTARETMAAGTCPPVSRGEIEVAVTAMAADRKLSPELLRSVIRQESDYDPCAVSSAGAQGLMQLMPAVQQQFGVGDPFDWRQSLSAGAQLLRELLDRYGGDVSLALGAYNAGPKRIDEASGIPDIPETRQFVRAVLERVNPP